jgi:hypothetical protein
MGKFDRFNKLHGLINQAMELVVRARSGEIDNNEALDGIWELLASLDYELQLIEREHRESLIHKLLLRRIVLVKN